MFGEGFKFESPMEKKIEREETKKEGEEKISKFLEEIAETLKKDGIPVEKDCRINMDAYKNVYPKEVIERDKKLISDYEKEWYQNLSEEEIEEQKLKKCGYKFEMLKTAIFSKFLGNEFVVLRASLYDDVKNNIDNVILDKEKSNVVCAFDEVGEAYGPRYERKKAKVLERNTKEGGGHLKYGLIFEKDEKNQSRISLRKVDHIPLFYLVLPERHIERGIEKLKPSFQETSGYEEKLFTYFLSSLSTQIHFLKLEHNLDPTLKERLLKFEETIKKFLEKK